MALAKNSAKPAEKEVKKAPAKEAAAPAKTPAKAAPAKAAAKAPAKAEAPAKAAPVASPEKVDAPKIGRKEISAALRAKVTTAGAAISEKVANVVAVAIEEVIGEALEAGQQIVLPGFGQFLIQHRPEAMKRSPATGEEVLVKAHNVVKFRVGSKLKARVNGGAETAETGEDE